MTVNEPPGVVALVIDNIHRNCRVVLWQWVGHNSNSRAARVTIQLSRVSYVATEDHFMSMKQRRQVCPWHSDKPI